jgi:hypothetical protein
MPPNSATGNSIEIGFEIVIPQIMAVVVMKSLLPLLLLLRRRLLRELLQ